MLVLMNPPFKSNLHLKILQEAAKHANDVVALAPILWLKKSMLKRPLGKWRDVFQGRVDYVKMFDHRTSNDMFGLGNYIEELSILRLREHSNFDLKKFGFDNDAEFSLYNKVDICGKALTYNVATSGVYGDLICICKDISHFRRPNDVGSYAWHKADNCYDAVVNNSDNPKLVLYFNTPNERQNFLNSLNTKFMDWYFNNYIVPGDYKEMNYMFLLWDYTQPVTDETFYKFFNLTDDEIKIVEAE